MDSFDAEDAVGDLARIHTCRWRDLDGARLSAASRLAIAVDHPAIRGRAARLRAELDLKQSRSIIFYGRSNRRSHDESVCGGTGHRPRTLGEPRTQRPDEVEASDTPVQMLANAEPLMRCRGHEGRVRRLD